MELTNRQIVGLYLFLTKHDCGLDTEMGSLFEKLEQHLFENLSIQEIEGLESLYKQGFDVLDQ